MSLSQRKIALTLAAFLALTGGIGCRVDAQESAPESRPETGHRITASGNLDAEITPCDEGDAWCGTVAGVLANNAMTTGAMPPMSAEQRAALIGKPIFADLTRTADHRLQGTIYRRANGKAYHCKVSLSGPTQLKLVICDDSPAMGQTQIWTRAASPAN